MTYVARLAASSAVAATCCLMAPGVSGAATTTIQPPQFGEHTHEMILEHVYGGDFTSFGGVHFTNGTVTVERVDDALDQIFDPASYDFEAEAVFALLDQVFGYLPGVSGGVFQPLMAVTGKQYDVTESVEDVAIENRFRWARSGVSGTQSSRDSDNHAGRDHMVSYLVTGLTPNAPTVNQAPPVVWLLFFEDLFENDPYADFDYNDLVVQVTAFDMTPVPEPASLGLGLLGAAMVLGRRRRA